MGFQVLEKQDLKKLFLCWKNMKQLEGIYENIDKLTEIAGIGKSLVNNLVEDKEDSF